MALMDSSTPAVICAILLGAILFSVSRGEEPHARSAAITVIGHRGNSSHFPENTLASFRGALKAKADYVELDAYPSADGTLWVVHDTTLDRTTDIQKHMAGKKIRPSTVHDDVLRQLDAGAWFAPEFEGEKLPTLAEALDVIQKSGKTLLERKEGDPAAYADLLKTKKLVGKLIVQAFDWDFLEALHKILPDQPLAALGGKQINAEKLSRLPATGVKIVAWDYKELHREQIADLHKRGYRVWCYTVDQPSDWQRLIADGTDGIISNRPGELREWLAGGERSHARR